MTKSKRAKGASQDDEEVPKNTPSAAAAGKDKKETADKHEEEDVKDAGEKDEKKSTKGKLAKATKTEVVKEEESNGGPSAEVKEEYTSLCRDLSMDGATEAAAWKSYLQIRGNYTLEVTKS